MHDQGKSRQPTPHSDPRQQPAAQAEPARDSAAPAEPARPSQRGYGATVRGQVQRVRVDLLSRETQRLGQTLQEIVDQQREDRRWRDHWQSRFSELSGQVDHLLDETSRVAATAAAGQDVKETVKPLLQAVLQMLDDGAKQSDAATDAMAELTPALRDLNAAAESLQQEAEVAQRPARPLDTPPPASDVPRPVDAAPPARSGPSDREPVRAEVLTLRDAAPAASPEAPAPAAPEAAAETAPEASPDEVEAEAEEEMVELRIEIARLLKPQPESEARDSLSLDELTMAPEPAAGPPPADDGPLLLGTDETPEIAPSRGAGQTAPRRPAALNETQGRTAAPEPKPEAMRRPEAAPVQPAPAKAAPKPEAARHPQRQVHRGQAPQGQASQGQVSRAAATREQIARTARVQAAQAARSAEAGVPPRPAQDQRSAAMQQRRRPNAVQAAPPVDRPSATRKPVTDAEARRMAVASARRAQREVPADEPEGLPKCLTERWERDPEAGAEWNDGAEAGAARDKGAFRWPFRRLRATIDQDHAADRAEEAPRQRPAPTQATRRRR